jgi:hypothetical protein
MKFTNTYCFGKDWGGAGAMGEVVWELDDHVIEHDIDQVWNQVNDQVFYRIYQIPSTIHEEIKNEIY